MDNYPMGVTDKDIDKLFGGDERKCEDCYYYDFGSCSLHEKLRQNCDDFERC